MLVTINTDASYSPHYGGCGGYAFWITCDKGQHKVSGPLKKTNSATIAEFMCIINALSYVKNNIASFPDLHKIIINTDCKTAININVVTPKKKRSKETDTGKYARELKKMMLDVAADIQLLVSDLRPSSQFLLFRHVKAHTLKEDARSYVNQWCDQESRKWMKKQRKEKGYNANNDN